MDDDSMANETIAQKKLQTLIKKLSLIRGRHTELITIYVPRGSNLNMVSNQVNQEQGTAANIKSKAVRKNVLAALEKISQHLKFYKTTPPNGLALFSGNTSLKEGESDIDLWAIEPPEPLNQRLYRCDQEFVLDPLKHMVREKEVYGMVVLDKSDSEIGMLKGKRIESLKHLDSLVPGKTKKGGWCIHEDSLIQLANGRIEKIKDLKNEQFLCYDFKDLKISHEKHNHYCERKSENAFEIETIAPSLKIVTTPEHRFFIPTENGYGTIRAEDIDTNTKLLLTKKMDIEGSTIRIKSDIPTKIFVNKKGLDLITKSRKKLEISQKILSKKIKVTQTAISKFELGKINLRDKKINRILDSLGIEKGLFLKNYSKEVKAINVPPFINYDFAQLLGYIIGDGNSDKNRITISEEDPEILRKYKIIIKRLFSLNAQIKKRNNRNYYELRICSKSLLDLLNEDFPGIITPYKKSIPENICKLKGYALCGFVKGLFDAEGWIDKKAKIIGLTMNEKLLIMKLQLILQRWGILSSIFKIGTKGSFAKRDRYCIKITDKLSQISFSENISFSSNRKKVELGKITNKSDTSYVDQIPINGTYLLKLLRKNGFTTGNFPKVQDFFYDKKGMSYKIFEKNIMHVVRKKSEIYDYLNKIISSNLVSAKVKSIKKISNKDSYYDMEIPKYNSFISNGFVLHNSQARYARVRDGLLNDHMKKTGELATSYFREMQDLKGIIVGGPGPIKDMFVNGDFLPTDIKKKVMGVVDTSYTGKVGLDEILERGEDLLAEASVTHERKLLERFFSELAKDSGLGIYGIKETMKALEDGSVDILLISEDFSWVFGKFVCPKCDKKLEKLIKVDKKNLVECPECSSTMKAEEVLEAADKFIDSAELVNTKVEIISTDTREGEQLSEMGGIAGILRYKI